MIYGIGTDIVTINRIEKAITLNNKFAEKILSDNEIIIFNEIDTKANFLAKRFAAKEAFAKACGTGIRTPIFLKHIEIINNDLGKPDLKLSKEIYEWLNKNQIKKHHLSIADEKEYAIAFVILEQ
jgi:holo-[acyl-carrier protein] synthase